MVAHVVLMVLIHIHVTVHLVILVEIVKHVSTIVLMSYESIWIIDSVNPCIPNPCQNGGRCRPNLAAGNYVCECPANFNGPNCETSMLFPWIFRSIDIYIYFLNQGNPCGANPCLNGGQCIPNNVGGFTCSCPNPYTGQRCEDRKIDHFLRMLSQLFLN